jgi:hypothetical protein
MIAIAAGITPSPIVNLQARSTKSLDSGLPVANVDKWELVMTPRLIAKARRRLRDCIAKTAASIVPLDSVEAHSVVMTADKGYSRKSSVNASHPGA